MNAWLIRFWDWIDQRNVDLHLVMAITLYLTWYVIRWAVHFADAHPENVASVAGILTPWAMMQAAMFSFYVGARK